MDFPSHRATLPGLARGVDRGLPWAAAVSVLATGSLTYTEKVQEAASSSDTITAGLIARLDKHDAALAQQEEKLDELAQRTVAIAAEEEPQQPPNPPGRSARIRP